METTKTISRERILEAASRVYSKHGFRGATTRLIANEAGVNEVTLFRTFGSKSALLQAVLEQYHVTMPVPELPTNADDVHGALCTWIDINMERVRGMRELLIHSMGEIDERPAAAEFACRGRLMVHTIITTFIRMLQEKKIADRDADVDTSAAMLTGIVMSDAFARSIVPDVYPPIEHAAARYANCFLRMIGVKKSALASVRKA